MERRSRLVACAIVVVLFMAAFACNKAERAEGARQKSLGPQAQRAGAFMPPYYADVRGVSVPQTLPPERFAVAKTRESYRVAGTIPEALMQLPCYCWCDRIDHKSLLDCFVDEHAEYCGICQDSALWAEKRLKERASLATIRQEIVDHYSGEYGRR